MQLTLSIEDRLVERAQNAAREKGKSLTELLEDLVKKLAEENDIERDVGKLRRLSREGRDTTHGWRSVFGKARPADVAEIDKIVSEELEQVDLDTWQ